MKRKLLAILVADVVGYSRLMSEDDEATLAGLRAFRKSVFEPATRQNDGRIVKLMGDGALVEFTSIVQAVKCATIIQRQASNSESPYRLRIGVHLGDVISEGQDIYGDGVNVAARLENLADPGSICISEISYKNLDKQTRSEFTDAGERDLKNIPGPVRVYNWIGKRSSRPQHEQLFELPEKPSIAVLPFDNMSGDPDQEYFADGISEDIITALSRSPWLFVIARNSSFSFRGQSIELRSIAEKLGVRYLLEGSVRKAGDRVRITAQLIDGISGSHVWAEKYDGSLDDIFELQDEITRNVVSSMHTSIRLHEGTGLLSEKNGNIKSWDMVRRAWKMFYELRQDSLEEARKLMEQAIKENELNNEALYLLAGIMIHEYHLGFVPDPNGFVRNRAMQLVQRSIALDASHEDAHWVAGLVHMYTGDYDGAIAELEKATELNPNHSLSYGSLGTVLAYAGQSERSIRCNEIAMRINPRDPSVFFRYIGMAVSHFLAGRYDDAAAWARKVVIARPEYDYGYAMLAASQAELGEIEAAQSTLAAFSQRFPEANISHFARMPFHNREHLDRITGALKKAGLSE